MQRARARGAEQVVLLPSKLLVSLMLENLTIESLISAQERCGLALGTMAFEAQLAAMACYAPSVERSPGNAACCVSLAASLVVDWCR